MKPYHEWQYHFGRNLSKFVFDTAFHPTIVNGEKIPQKGPIVFCGNHLHVWDQFPVMSATGEVLHWMTKKEYFEGSLGWVFKFMGCIKVDRQGNAHASSEEAVSYLLNGHSVALFPEGTRNGLKEKDLQDLYLYAKLLGIVDETYEEFTKIMKQGNPRLSQVKLLKQIVAANEDEKRHAQEKGITYFIEADKVLQMLIKLDVIGEEEYADSLLLPFKEGGVSMAKETHTPIVPFAVTGDYKIGNDNLTVNFGDPFMVDKQDIEEADLLLRHKIKTLLLENYQR